MKNKLDLTLIREGRVDGWLCQEFTLGEYRVFYREHDIRHQQFLKVEIEGSENMLGIKVIDDADKIVDTAIEMPCSCCFETEVDELIENLQYAKLP